MTEFASARARLRSQTALHHQRVDAVFSRFDLTDRCAYGRFLLAQAEAVTGTEAALERADAQRWVSDWPERRRGALVLDDLTSLGLAAPTAVGQATFEGEAAVLGGVYVLEGSRLGGVLLKRATPPTWPTAFLGAPDPVGWRRLMLTLDARLRTAEDINRAVDAAARVFALFEASGLRYSEGQELGG